MIEETRLCPGCGETLYLDWADGWRNDRGLGCVGLKTHSDSLLITANQERKTVRDVIAENGGISPIIDAWA